MEMQLKRSHILVITLVLALGGAATASALTITDMGPTAPSYSYGQSISAGSGEPPSNTVFSTKPTIAGETFTIASATPLRLTDIAVKGNATNNAVGLTWTLYFFSVSGSTPTILDTETGTVTGGTAGAKDYINFTLANNIVLYSAQQYGFVIGVNGKYSIDGARASSVSFTGNITGVSAALDTATFGTLTTSPDGDSRVFYLNTTSVPEPAGWAFAPLLISIGLVGWRRLAGSPKPGYGFDNCA